MTTTPIPADRLTPRQVRFIEQYLATYNATEAAKKAGYSAKSAKIIGCELLARLEAIISPRLKAQQTQLAKRLQLSKERVLTELACLAFADPGKMFDQFGNCIEIPALPARERRAVAAFEVVENFEGQGESRKSVGFTRRVKLADKRACLAEIARLQGYYPGQLDEEPARGAGDKSVQHVWNIKVVNVEAPRPPAIVTLPANGNGNGNGNGHTEVTR